MKDHLHNSNQTVASEPEQQIAGKSMSPPTFQLFAGATNKNAPLMQTIGSNNIAKPGDDYFDEKGNYLFSDLGHGNGIFLIASATWMEISKRNSVDRSEMFALGEEERSRIHKNRTSARHLSFDSPDSELGLSRLLGSYLEAWNIGGVECRPKVLPENDIMTTGPNEKGDLTIFINVTPDGRLQYPSLADNKFDLVNTLVHEKCHADAHFDKDASGQPKSMATKRNVSAEACIRHLESYFEQMSHASWQLSSRSYKTDHLQEVGSFLAWISEHEANDLIKDNLAKSWQEQFESSFGFSFGGEGPNRQAKKNEIVFLDK